MKMKKPFINFNEKFESAPQNSLFNTFMFKNMVIFLLISILPAAADNIKIDIGNKKGVETELEIRNENWQSDILWTDSELIPDKLSYVSDYFCFGSADYYGILYIYFTDIQTANNNCLKNAGLKIRDKTSFKNYTFSAGSSRAFCIIRKSGKQADYIMGFNPGYFGAGLVLSDYRYKNNNQIYTSAATGLIFRPYLSVSAGKGQASFSAGILGGISAKYPLSFLAYSGFEYASAGTLFTIIIKTASPYFINSDGKYESDLLSVLAKYQQRIFSCMRITLKNNFRLDKRIDNKIFDEQCSAQVQLKISAHDTVTISSDFDYTNSADDGLNIACNNALKLKRSFCCGYYCAEYNYSENFHSINSIFKQSIMLKINVFELTALWTPGETLKLSSKLNLKKGNILLFYKNDDSGYEYGINVRLYNL